MLDCIGNVFQRNYEAEPNFKPPDFDAFESYELVLTIVLAEVKLCRLETKPPALAELELSEHVAHDRVRPLHCSGKVKR